MSDRPTSWKVPIVGPTGVAVEGSAFRLLYSFPTREEAEEHAECFLHTGVRLALCDERGNLSQSVRVKGGEKPDRRGGAKIDHFWRREGLICLDRQGWLERRPAPPFLGGAFRPERKAPLPI